jgi:hypothetical protein
MYFKYFNISWFLDCRNWWRLLCSGNIGGAAGLWLLAFGLAIGSTADMAFSFGSNGW